MSDDLLNGRRAEPFELAAIRYGRECELERDLRQLAGLLADYPRDPAPVPRRVSDLSLDRLS